jgi:ABC-2 type transport system ATP-binding protein
MPIVPSPAPLPRELAIETSALVKTYGRIVRALDGLTFSVRAGTVFGLLGPNGAGKSTTVKVLNTLTRPDSGVARVEGIDVVRLPDAVRRVIGCVAQKSGVDVNATGRENLVLQGRFHGLAGSDLHARARALLDRFGLTPAADRQARTYSGGMQRKLDVAMGLVHRPAVLFLDEPTTGLDPEARAGLWEEIRRLEADGLAILLTTHYLEEADRLAARLAIVDQGRIVAEGTPEALKAELRGDAIHVELDSAAAGPQAAGVLARLDGLGRPSIDGATLSARADRAASAVPSVLAALDGAGIAVASVTVARPSLDDVYLRHTGRTYRPDATPTARVLEVAR